MQIKFLIFTAIFFFSGFCMDQNVLPAKAASGRLSVQGTVTALPGVFGVQYFYISDGRQGFQVYQHKKDFPKLKVGDKISVGGETSYISGVTRIKIPGRSSIKILGHEDNFAPLDISSLSEVGEGTVGSLVRISGEITSIKSSYLYIDDGNSETMVYFRAGAKIDNKAFEVGDDLEVTGILEKTKNGLRVTPRGNDDMKVKGMSSQTSSSAIESGSLSGTRRKYIAVTAVAGAALLTGLFIRSRDNKAKNGEDKPAETAGNTPDRG